MAPQLWRSSVPEFRRQQSALTQWMDEGNEALFEQEYRNYLHRKQLTNDMTVQAIGGVVLAICGTRLLLDRLWLPASLAFLSTVLSLSTTAFITYHHKLWCRHRELFFFAAFLCHYSVAAFIGAGGLNFMAHHGGSCFRSFVHFAYSNTAVWQLLNALLSHIVFRRLVLLQLPLALVALPWGGRLCRDALSHPGAEAVVRRMFCNLSGISMFWAGPTALPARKLTPQTMCCTLNAWTLVVCGMVVPLYLAFFFELRDRAVFLRAWHRSPRRDNHRSMDGSSSSSGLLPPSGNDASGTGGGDGSGGAGGETEDPDGAALSAPPPPLGRRRWRRLHRLLAAAVADTSESAEVQQEALAELLRPAPPRRVERVVAEAALVSLLCWPVVVVLVDVASGWVCRR